MNEEIIDLSSQNLCEVPDFLLSSANVQKLILDFNEISFIPSCLCQTLTKLSFLSLNGNRLENLPSNIHFLKNLTELWVKENFLSVLPSELSGLKMLKKLYLTGNQIKNFPRELDIMHNLLELTADENEITYLPKNFGNLNCLTFLDISNNSLLELPESFGNLANLRKLDLSNNKLTYLPESFKNLPNLEILDLTENKIKLLPDNFASTKTIKKILMNENCLTGLPPWLSESENLEEMCFSANDLLNDPFPENFGIKNNNLSVINVSGNNIKYIPYSFGNLTNLQFLDFGSSFDELERNRFIANGNKLQYLPDTFTNLEKLIKLEFDENELVQLPDNIGQLVNLTYLDLSHNNLKFLPDSFCLLKSLKVCLLSMNYLIELPSSFGKLATLEDLKLDNNLLSELPESFGDLECLTSLDLYNNYLERIPNVLQELKNLKQLDIRENDLGIPFEEIPEIKFEPTYLKRKEEFKNSWRGRKRSDINEASWVESKNEIQKKELEDDVIFSALTSASSLWRKHGQSNIRQKPIVTIPGAEYLNNENELSEYLNGSFIANEEECWDDDLYDVKFYEHQNKELPSQENNDGYSSSEDLNELAEKFAELSDWDSDCDDLIPNNFNKIYRHPVIDKPDVNVLIPSDLHAKQINVQVPEIWQSSEEGQFDDADS